MDPTQTAKLRGRRCLNPIPAEGVRGRGNYRDTRGESGLNPIPAEGVRGPAGSGNKMGEGGLNPIPAEGVRGREWLPRRATMGVSIPSRPRGSVDGEGGAVGWHI